MSERKYIGARYVPLFIGDWDNTKTYEPLSIVQYQGDSYTSRQYVPTGIEITNETYWAITGNYNTQVEQYREEVADLATEVEGLENIIPSSEYSSTNTVKDAIDQCTSDIDTLETAVFTVTNYAYNEMLSNAVEDYTIQNSSAGYKRCGIAIFGLLFIAENGYTQNTDAVVGYLIPELRPPKNLYLPTWDEGVYCYITSVDGAIHYKSTTETVNAGSRLHWIRASYMTESY